MTILQKFANISYSCYYSISKSLLPSLYLSGKVVYERRMLATASAVSVFNTCAISSVN